jgi:autotransporter-associated beta strand protein/T5SS/PEP-CTERM-associated repeat protein
MTSPISVRPGRRYTNRGRALWLASSALSSLAALSSAHAQTAWTAGANTTDWFTAGNWDNGVPNGAVAANINTASPFAPAITIGAATAQSITLSTGGRLRVASGGGLSAETIFVGSFGDGTFEVAGGATVSISGGAATLLVGNNVGSTGQATISGIGTALTTSATTVGNFGTGTVSVLAGGTMTTSSVGNLGTNSGTGSVNVDGAGSTWNVNVLRVGEFSNGNLTISNNGVVNATSTSVGTNNNGVGRLNIGAASGAAAAAAGTLNTANVAFGTGSGRIVFNHTETNYTFAPTISGAGSVRVESGTTIFGNANTYSGGTTLSGGTLQVNTGAAIGSGALTFDGGTLRAGAVLITASNAITLASRGGTIDTVVADVGLSGAITGAGSLTKLGSGTLTLNGNNTYTGATNIDAGTLVAAVGNAIGDQSAVTVAAGATFALSASETIGSLAGAGSVGTNGSDPRTLTTGGNGASTVFSGVMSNVAPGFAGPGVFSLVKDGAGTLALTGTNTYTGTTTVNGGTLQLGNGGTTGSLAGAITLNAGTTLAVNRSDNLTLTNAVTGGGAFAQNGTGTTTFNQAFTYAGGTTVNAGTLQLTGAGTLGASTATTRVNTGGTLDLGGTTQTQNGGVTIAGGTIGNGTLNSSGTFTGLGGTVSAVLGGSGNLVQTSGTTNLTATNAYTGSTMVNGGTLAVNGSIASSSGTTVNAGGTLGGTGILGNVTVNGGTLAPGNSIGTVTVNGNLALTAASSYMVEIDPTTSDRTNVTGTATLGGARVSAIYANGSYVSRRYTILNAQGGVIGTFSALVNTNLPAGFTPTVAYDANNAYLDMALNFTPPPPAPGGPAFAPLNINQRNVANALINSFNTAGGIPLVFGTLNAAGLTQVSGEHATGTQQTTFDAMDRFINVMTDPFMGTRAGGAPATAATGYADEEALAYAGKRKRTGAEQDAYAKMAVKAPPRVTAFDRRWSVWGAGYGGTQSTDGNDVTGSQRMTNHVYGGAAGFDYRLTPETMVGFSLGGAGTNFSVANLGGGRSEMFQAGVYGRHTMGPAYLAGALAWGWQDVTLDRTVFGNVYRAGFDANALSGRLEGGYRFAYGTSGITPYAAGQFTSFWQPGYAEQLVAGVNTFALAYSDRNVTSSRSELGLRGDTSFAAADAVVTLRGRAAWAHNFNITRGIDAIFQTLPASGFTVFGASPARDSALVTASAETKWLNGFSVSATFEGEFSRVTDSYAGKGVVRYQW